jgi:ABC-2 type transport system ATP-binding protein
MLELQGVTKVYGSRKAVDNISFSVGDHEILGFLGLNGAGKSTTMNIIAGYTSATSGTVRINGREILEDPIGCKKQIGYLPERPPLYPDMTVEAYLSFIFDLKKVPLPKKDHIAGVCEVVGITEARKRIIKNLSKGYQQRVGLAQAMLGDPPLLILDEPTVGLDPEQLSEVRDVIRELGKRCAVIFSSHILQEIQAVCGRIIIINNGVLIADDTPERLSKAAGGNKILLCAEAPSEELLPALRSLPGIESAEQTGVSSEPGTVEVFLESGEGKDVRRDLWKLLVEKGWPMLSLRGSGLSLEDAFLRLNAGYSSGVFALPQKDKKEAEGGTA